MSAINAASIPFGPVPIRVDIPPIVAPYAIPNNKLVVRDSEERAIKILLNQYEVNESFVTIIPGATWKQKTWLSERYSEVIDYIINKLKYKVVMLGGDNDNICNSISKINNV